MDIFKRPRGLDSDSDRFEWALTFFFQQNSASSRRIFFAFIDFADIWSGVVFFDEVISLLEFMELLRRLVEFISLSLSKFGNGSSLLMLSIIENSVLAAFFQAHNVSAQDVLLFDFRGWFAWAAGDVWGGVEVAAEGSFIDLELDDFLVSIYKVLILVFIFKTVLKGELSDVSSVFDLFVDLAKQVADFFSVGPEVGLDFRKNKKSVDLYLEGPVPREYDDFLFLLIEVSLQT